MKRFSYFALIDFPEVFAARKVEFIFENKDITTYREEIVHSLIVSRVPHIVIISKSIYFLLILCYYLVYKYKVEY